MSLAAIDSDELRRLINDSLSKNLYQTSILFSETLVLLKDCTTADVILYAKCHLDNGQPRRCLSVLERKGLLSNDVVKSVQAVVNPLPVHVLDKQPLVDQYLSVIDSISGIYMAAQCLFLIGQYDDCLCLVEPLVSVDGNESINTLTVTNNVSLFVASEAKGICQMSALYCLVGKCFFAANNRAKSLAALLMSLKIDSACLESLDFITEHCMLSEKDRIELYEDLLSGIQCGSRSWLKMYFQNLLNCFNDGHVTKNQTNTAENLFRDGRLQESYQLAKMSYSIDPYDSRCLFVYVACLVQLNHSTELFYLGHELVHSFPKVSSSWYSVGCYYWCCNKMEIAQSYFNKAARIDKRNAKYWVMLGHVFSAQQESEQAIAAYRTAVQLLPGDCLSMVFMAKELLKTNHFVLALQILLASLNNSSHDHLLFNEVGVAYCKLNNNTDALTYLTKAISQIYGTTHLSQSVFYNDVNHCDIEIISNFATALRKNRQCEEALMWFEKCLVLSPLDVTCHVDIGFTLHLLRRFDDSITTYHRALALQPSNSLCLELLNLVVEDNTFYMCSNSSVE